MDSHIYRYFVFIAVIIVGACSRYEETYYGRIFILPENEDSQRPLKLALPEARDWCTNSLPGSTLPKIIEDRDNIFKFIKNAFAANRLNNGQIVLVNGMKHTRGGWSWINGHDTKGIDVKTELRDDKVNLYTYGYLWTEGEYSIQASLSSDERYYICEFENFRTCSVNISRKCYSKKNVQKTRFQARSSCITEKGDLASFETLSSSILKVSLQNLFRDRRGPDDYWIGIQRSRLHLDDKDSEIKFINWTDVHQSGSRGNNCLCLNASMELKWLECDCQNEYPFICTGIETNDSFASSSTIIMARSSDHQSINQPIKPSSSIDQPTITPMIISDLTILSTDASSTLISPIDQSSLPNNMSAIIGAVVSCFIIAVIIIIVIVVVIISRRQRNRPVKTHTYEAKAITTDTVDERNIYSEIQEPIEENQNIASCSASNTTYATIQPTPETNEEFQTNNIVYAELDLSPKA